MAPWLLAAVLGASSSALPSESSSPTAEVFELQERLEVLHERLSAQRTHAEVWWRTVMIVYGAGVIVQAVRAGVEDDRAHRVDRAVGAVKAAAGVVRYGLEPFGGIEGPARIAPPELGTLDLRTQVLRAERLLLHNAEATQAFGPWYAHVGNFILNAAGALIVGLGYGDWSTGVISALVGFAVGEAALLTQPWSADRDLAAYRRRFGSTLLSQRPLEVHPAR